MKKTVKELANETTTSTSGISDVQGKRWLKSILKAAEENMYFKQFAYETEAGAGIKDLSVPISTSNKSFTDYTTQATARTMTEIDNVTAVVFTPAPHKFGATIAADVIRTSQVDVVQFARGQMALSMSDQIDTAMSSSIALATTGSLAANIYGGDATTPATLATGDVFELPMVSEAKRALALSNWRSSPGAPLVLFISPYEEKICMDSSQFTNAAEYGNNEVVMNGEIGKYLGFKIVVTNNLPSYDAADQDVAIAGGTGIWGPDGHTCFALKAKIAYGLVWGLKPKLDWEYDKDLAAYKIYLDTAYHADTLQDGAIVDIRVSNA